MPVTPIDDDTRRELFRHAFDQIVLGNVPIVGGALASIGRVVAPSALDRELARWRSDVTDTINSLEQLVNRLCGSVQISDFAMQIGVHISGQSDDGIANPYSIDYLLDRFVGASEQEIVEACGELENACLARFHQSVNSTGYLSVEVALFEAFDPFVHGWHPTVDGANLGRYVAQYSASGSVILTDDMANHFRWGHRRLNPALQLVARYIDEGRKCTAYTPPWAHRYVWADPSERAALRQMAREVLGDYGTATV
ncbi:MAG: hypothetical protein ACREVD_07900 [Burkholderiales bacterium]